MSPSHWRVISPTRLPRVPGVVVQQLFCHTAGLPYAVGPDDNLRWPERSAAVLRVAPVETPGTLLRYSDVGYALLALVVERVSGRPFPTALAELVLTPLGMGATFGVDPPRARVRVAGSDWHNTPGWPDLADPASCLVGTAADALALARAFRPGVLLRDETCAAATRDQTGGVPAAPGMFWPIAPWGLGPCLQHSIPPYMFAPPAAGPRAYAHGGSTGCVAWGDPDADVSAAILSTRAGGPWFSDTMATIGAAILGVDA